MLRPERPQKRPPLLPRVHQRVPLRHIPCVQDVDAATVLERLLRDPFADGSLPDIFVDNCDASSVVVNGEWETVANPWRAYGPDYLSD